MGGKITHELVSESSSLAYDIRIKPHSVIDKIVTKHGSIDIVNLDRLFAGSLISHGGIVVTGSPYFTSASKFVMDEPNKGLYLLRFQQCGMNIHATLQMVTNEHGILRYTDGRSFDICGDKYRIKNWSYSSYKPLLLSNSKERLLIHHNSDPLDIRQVKQGCISSKIDLWDYDTSDKLLLPHLFRLEIEGKLIHNKQ
jgi:hypothetical protein